MGWELCVGRVRVRLVRVRLVRVRVRVRVRVDRWLIDLALDRRYLG